MKKILVLTIVGFLILSGLGVAAITTNEMLIDNHPPEKPTITGPYWGKPGVEYDFTFNAVDPDRDNVSYYIDWGDGTITGWTGYNPSGTDCVVPHTWDKVDEFIISAKAKDTYGNESDWATKPMLMQKNKVNIISSSDEEMTECAILDNHPPDAPTIKGKVHIDKVGIPYDYKFKAIDPDGDNVRYFIDWGDGTSEWTDYYASGEEIIISHTWPAKGTVTLKARANDTHGALGPWGYIQWSISTEVNVELERILDNLRFMCTSPGGFNSVKYEYYKEQLLCQYPFESSKGDIVVEPEKRELAIPVEPPSSPIASVGGPMDSAWPMKCHDLRHTSQSPYSTVDTCAEKWRFECGWLEDTPIIDNDGTVYFGCNDRYIYAIHPNGTLKWKYKTGGIIWGSSPAIADDGTIYVGSWDGFLHAINPDGTEKWKFPANSANIGSSPAIADDGTIYFGTLWSLGDGGKIHAVNPDGTEKWRYQTGWHISSDPAISDDGTVYIGSGDSYLYAMNPNGTLKWRFKTGDEIHGHPSIAEDGTVLIASWDHYLYALYPNNGTMKWKRGSGYSGDSSVAIGEDDTLYFGGNNFYAVYPDGTTKWIFNLDNRDVGKSSPAISADGTIYIGVEIGDGDGGEIIAINSDGTERWRKKIANKWIDSSASIAEDGTVYIGTTDSIGAGGYLYAFGVGKLEADAHGPYYGITNQPIQFTGTSSGGYSPHSYFWDFGDTFTSEEQNPIHTYTSPGNYTLVLTVTDNESNTVTDSTYAWIQTTNTAPDKPTIDGPTHGKVGVTYDYNFTATDPDNSIIYIFVDWGDNSNTGWVGPYDSGQQVTLSHKWSNEDTFHIKAKAKDPYNDEGPWGELQVTMQRNKATNNVLLQRLLEMFPLLQKLLFQFL